ncbi:P-loop containing nucleoside triphosphate hydrolase protein, partial [Caulochytrium protostelioides]
MPAPVATTTADAEMPVAAAAAQATTKAATPAAVKAADVPATTPEAPSSGDEASDVEHADDNTDDAGDADDDATADETEEPSAEARTDAPEEATFASLCLDARLVRAATQLGWVAPTLVQSEAIPLALGGKDLLVRARTGSGKTAAYLLPLLQKLLVADGDAKVHGQTAALMRRHAVVLVPYKDLAAQAATMARQLTRYCSDRLIVLNLNAGHEIDVETAEHAHLWIGTPKAVHDALMLRHAARAAARAATARLATDGAASGAVTDTGVDGDAIGDDDRLAVDTFVIDEADLILQLGHKANLTGVVRFLPSHVHTILLSATLDPTVQELKHLLLHAPAVLTLDDRHDDVDMLTQYVVARENTTDKFLLLYFLLRMQVDPFASGKTLIFVNSTASCYRVKLFLEQFGIRTCCLNPELPLASRTDVLKQFNRGLYRIIIATDASNAARIAALKASKKRKAAEDAEARIPETEPEAGADADAEAAAADAPKSDAAIEAEEADEERRLAEEEAAYAAALAAKSVKTSTKSSSAAAAAAATPTEDPEYSAARGIDFANVQTVINFEVPETSRAYAHRVGRTARGVNRPG